MICRIIALARALIFNPVAPTSLLELINPESAYKQFRDIVRMVFPDRFDEIMDAGGGRPGDQETERVWAFGRLFEEHWFPIYEAEEYGQLAWGIPFIHEGWSGDDFHDIQSRSAGDLMIGAFCEEPYLDLGTRVPLLDEVSSKVSVELVRRIPDNGFSPKRLHAALDGAAFSAVADYIDWMWGMTNTTFLDFDSEMEVTDADWEMEIVQELKERWQRAEALRNRIGELARRLEANPEPLFREILEQIEATPEPEGPNYPRGDEEDGDTDGDETGAGEAQAELAAVAAGALSLGKAARRGGR